MAYSQQRYSSYSASTAPAPQSSQQVSTQTLLNALHSAYATSKAYSVESSTSLVVNTWITAATEGPDGRRGGTVDVDLARKAWEHARRRAEDGCIILGSLHDSTPSLFAPFISALPINVPPVLYAALSAIQPFVQCVTPENPTKTLYSSLAATFTLSLSSNLIGASLKLSKSGIDTHHGLLNVPAAKGNRAFNAFYYLLNSASSSEREFLGLKGPSSYSLLRKSETYHPPSYLPTADDAAAADEFRTNLKAIGIAGHARRNLISVLAAILKLGDCLDLLIEEEELATICEEIADLLNVDPEVLLQKCSSQDRAMLIAGLYESLVDWVVMKANTAIAADIAGNKVPDSASDSDGRPGALTPALSEAEGDTVSISVIDIPSPRIGKAVALKTVFDDSEGINAEMKEDGVSASQPGHSVVNDMRAAVSECETELGIHGGHAGREKELEEDRRERILDRVGQESEDDSFLKTLLYPEIGQGIALGRYGRFDLPMLIGSSRVWFHLSLHPTDDLPAALAANAAAWSASSPSRQLRAWRLPEWANRRNKQFDFTADFDIDEFCNRYERLGCRPGKEGIENFILERGWSNGEVIIGKERVWVREGSWWEAESTLDLLPQGLDTPGPMLGNEFGVQHPGAGSQYFASPYESGVGLGESRDNLLQRNQSLGARTAARSLAPTAAHTVRSVSGGDYGLGSKGDDMKGAISSYNDLDPELNDPNHITHKTTSGTRRVWVTLTWMLTFWIPSFTLRYIGRMKRPDVRMAWREKVVLVLLIFFLNAAVIFYIIEFGRLLCPNYDKAWNDVQVSYHQGDSDFYVSVRGAVYDISKFWKTDHSSIAGAPVTDSAMLAVAGQNVDYMFPIPLAAGCAGLVQANQYIQLETNATNANPAVINSFQHTSGHFTHYPQSAFKNPDWYNVTFIPAMKQYYKGERVYSKKNVTSESDDETKTWAIINNNVYDLSDYFYTIASNEGATMYEFLDPDVQSLFQENSGTDITDQWNKFALGNSSSAAVNMNCLNNVFYVGKTDFRDTPRCQVNNYILLAFTLILCAVILVKFLAALQLGGKRKPAMQDKFVICQVPAYTEGEDQLRKGLDSLTALAYDNKRKLICVICDGMIVGGGNDRPTPKIVLDILGVDPKIDPPALPFKSVGQSNEQLNYGKVYSGLYEYEGNVVPYLVVVKVGKESEQTKAKPGNRGKRDSQILLMSFLNRVHHRAPMSPLELEMFHQINNIIGVDPELYEYLFMVDADTMVKEDSLNRLVSNCANDAKIAGICGETSLQNEERSWWTMIQVYEYYISHHLAKAFESLFGSVTCLPGCFCMYRLRTADKGKPLIISDKVVSEYADCDVDTLHKKNLLSLGEDRYLTTLMTKHFPHMKYKFVPAAKALTAAPESWSVLLSQRRRWINSTIHNLAELMFLKDMCGFCCFSMRFVVFIDLFGTIILPATCAYIGYLIYEVAKDPHNFPLVSIIMLASVYGLQMLIFIIKRQWQHIGWMIIYLIAFPVYSFLLPVYSFWKQDDFSWGSTRIVIGEKGNKQVVAIEDEGFDPRSIPLQRWDDYAVANNLPGSRGPAGGEKEYSQFGDGAGGAGYEMDDMRSVYSAAKPASTILTGFKSHGGINYHIPPQSPSPFQNRSMTPNPNMRQSTYSAFTRYTDNPHPVQSPPLPIHSPAMSQHAFNASNQRLMSLGNMSQAQFPSGVPGYAPSENNLMVHPNHSQASGMMLNRAGTQTPLGFDVRAPSRTGTASPMPNFQGNSPTFGPSDAQIVEAIQACLSVVDLDSVTKKQLKALAEQRLQCRLDGERKAFLDRQIDSELANM